MKVLLIGNSKSYEGKRIAEEFINHGHEFDTVSIKEMVIDIQENNANFTTFSGKDLMTYDIYIFRGMGEAKWEMMVFAKVLHSLGKVILEEKLATQRVLMTKLSYTLAANGIPTIDHKIIFSLPHKEEHEISEEDVKGIIYDYPFILKATQTSRGRGVYKIDNFEQFIEAYIEAGPKVLIQKYIPIKFDYRVFIVGSKILGVMKRFNSDESFLTNVSAGGTAEVSTLPEEVLEMCLKAHGVKNSEVSGVDIIEDDGKYYVLEVNNSPQFQGFEKATGINVAKEIVDYCVEKFKSKSN